VAVAVVFVGHVHPLAAPFEQAFPFAVDGIFLVTLVPHDLDVFVMSHFLEVVAAVADSVSGAGPLEEHFFVEQKPLRESGGYFLANRLLPAPADFRVTNPHHRRVVDVIRQVFSRSGQLLQTIVEAFEAALKPRVTQPLLRIAAVVLLAILPIDTADVSAFSVRASWSSADPSERPSADSTGPRATRKSSMLHIRTASSKCGFARERKVLMSESACSRAPGSGCPETTETRHMNAAGSARYNSRSAKNDHCVIFSSSHSTGVSGAGAAARARGSRPGKKRKAQSRASGKDSCSWYRTKSSNSTSKERKPVRMSSTRP
jgi:hypothetical protein